MENTNAPAINVTFVNMAPGVDDAVLQRYHKWITEVNQPIQMKIAGMTGIDRYTIIRKNPE